MYLRFVVVNIDPESERRLGVLHALFRLERSAGLSAGERARIKVIADWFNHNLKRPTRFTAAKPPYYRKKQRGISWLKDNAHDHLRMMWKAAAVLQGSGIHVSMLRSRRVGYLIYEDDYQVVAEPFADMIC